MKKGVIILVIFVIVVIAPLILLLNQYQAEKNEVKKFNLEFEQYKDQNIYGTDIGSLMNYAIDNNEKYNIE